MGYMQDHPVNSEKHRNALYAGPYNHLGYRQDPNPRTLTVTLIRSVSYFRTNQTHHPRKSPLCFQEYTIFVGRLF